MLIVMEAGHAGKELKRVVSRVQEVGCASRVIRESGRVLVAVRGPEPRDPGLFEGLPGVSEVVDVTKSHTRLAGRPRGKSRTVLDIGGVKLGGDRFTVIAGPCAVESEGQLLRIARAVKKAGAHMLRGGAFKPRSSPYNFQGLGVEGLAFLKAAKKETGLPVVTEAVDVRTLDEVCEAADVAQIGARNMQNYALLKAAGRIEKPVMIKRAPAAGLDDWLMAAEYVLKEGNPRVFLCERGRRSRVDARVNALDLSAVLAAEQHSRLPVIADPSHGTGRREWVPAMALAAAAAGAHGVMVEVHEHPERALTDSRQALSIAEFQHLMKSLKALSRALGFKL